MASPSITGEAPNRTVFDVRDDYAMVLKVSRGRASVSIQTAR
jgi:hypothetical protein